MALRVAGGGSGGGGSSTFVGLSDASTANIQTINVPLSKQLGIDPIAMAGTVIDITNLSNTKTLGAPATLSFSSAPALGNSFGLILTMTAGAMVTLPSVFDDRTQTVITQSYFPVGEWSLSFFNDGTRTIMYGNPDPINNATTTSPGTSNDNTQGFGVGSQWLNTATSTVYTCFSAATGAAVWAAPASIATTMPMMGLGDTFAIIPSGGGSTGWTPGFGSFTGPTVSSSNGSPTIARTGEFATGHPFTIRIGIQGAAAVAGSSCGVVAPTRLTAVPSAVAGSDTIRFMVVCGGMDTNGGNFGIGATTLTNGFWTPSAGAALSTQTNILCLGCDIGDAQMTLMCNGSSGTATKTVLNGGTGFPANTSGADMYMAYFQLNGGATQTVNYIVKNLCTGVTATGQLTNTAKLPAPGSVLYPGFARYAPNSGTPTAIADLVGIWGGAFAALNGN